MWIQVLATVLAAMDIWSEGDGDNTETWDLRVSAALCCVHFFLLGILRWDSRLGLCGA